MMNENLSILKIIGKNIRFFYLIVKRKEKITKKIEIPSRMVDIFSSTIFYNSKCPNTQEDRNDQIIKRYLGCFPAMLKLKIDWDRIIFY